MPYELGCYNWKGHFDTGLGAAILGNEDQEARGRKRRENENSKCLSREGQTCSITVAEIETYLDLSADYISALFI